MRIQSLPLVVTVVASVALAVTAPSLAHAQPATPAEWPTFYTPPDPLPAGDAGDIIRAEPVVPPVPYPATITRVMYRSTDTHGSAIAVTGAVFDPIAPWPGPGPRPIVSYAAGTNGLGPQCAPSELLDEVIHYQPPLDLMYQYEAAFIDLMLARGIAVALTDYEQRGVPGVHPYLNPISEGHTVIDAVRAAQRLPGTDIPADGPVAFWGYSQGGNSAAGAAELAGSYAPELKLVGSYLGAPPPEPVAETAYLEKGAFRGLIGQFLAGLRSAFPDTGPEIDRILNDKGQAMVAATATMCIPEVAARYFSEPTSVYTKDGRLLSEDMAANPVIAAAMDRLRIGRIRPSAPVMVTTGSNDDIVDSDQVRRLAGEWCSRGAVVQFVQSPFPMVLPGTGIGHVVNAAYLNPTAGTQWLLDRIAGNPAPTNC